MHNREVALGKREAAAARREADVARREAALAERLEAAQGVLVAADLRDDDAGARDNTSVERDLAADLDAFVVSESGGQPYQPPPVQPPVFGAQAGPRPRRR